MGAQPRRGVLPAAVFLGACLLCLGTGYYTGKMYLDSQGSNYKRTKAGQAIHAPGTTRYLGLNSATGREPVCLNTCKTAKDGVCNDGRFAPRESKSHNLRYATCDLGTDCDDCGPWTPSGHAPWIDDNMPGPIARLQEKGVQVRVRSTITVPSFDFAFTDPAKDLDVSAFVQNHGGVELGITKVFYKIFQHGCVPAGEDGQPAAEAQRGLLVDVGSNFGWFAVQAASMGCRVVAFEPVPHFHAFLEYSVHLNGFAHLVDMRTNVVSHESGKKMEMYAPSRGIWGTAGIGGLNIDKAVENSTNEVYYVESQTLDELIKEDVLLLKVDVEGWEWSVMNGAGALLRDYSVENIIMEYSPGVPERHFKFREMKATVQMLVSIVDAGYSLAHLGDTDKHMHGGWESDLDPYEEITRHNLMYDLLDVGLFSQMQLGCPIPPEIEKMPAWAVCNALPEDVNPRSLRSLIGHNTNIWAAKKGAATQLQPLRGVVGILKPDAPPTQWTIPNGTNTGQGSRPCDHLTPNVQVRHRCPCTFKDKCGTEEQLVQAAAAAGHMAQNYVLTPDGKMLSAGGAPAVMLARIGSAEAVGTPYRMGAIKGMLSDVNKPLGLYTAQEEAAMLEAAAAGAEA